MLFPHLQYQNPPCHHFPARAHDPRVCGLLLYNPSYCVMACLNTVELSGKTLFSFSLACMSSLVVYGPRELSCSQTMMTVPTIINSFTSIQFTVIIKESVQLNLWLQLLQGWVFMQKALDNSHLLLHLQPVGH